MKKIAMKKVLLINKFAKKVATKYFAMKKKIEKIATKYCYEH